MAPSIHYLQDIKNCTAHFILTKKKHKTDHIKPLFQALHELTIPQRIKCKINTLCYNLSLALLHLISVILSNFTHPLILSALLLILSASRSLIPDFPQLVPVSLCLQSLGTIRPSPSSPKETLSGFLQIWPKKSSFSKTLDPPCSPLLCCFLPPSLAPVCKLSFCYKLCIMIVHAGACGSVWVSVYA